MTEQQLTLEQAFDLGKRFAQQGNLQQATDIFHRIIAAFPAFAPARTERALVALSQGEPETAEHVLRPLLTSPEKTSEALLLFCEALLLQGKFDEALTLIREAIAAAPDLWLYHLMHGNLLLKKDPQNAEPAYWRVLELNPDATSTAIVLTQLLTRQVHLDQAIDKLEALIRIRPKSIIYRYMHCSSIVQMAKLKGFDVAESLSSSSTAATSPEMKALYALFSSGAYFQSGAIPKANGMVKQALDTLRTLNLDVSKLLSQPSPDQVTKLERYLDERAVSRNDEEDFYQSDDFLSKVFSEYFETIEANDGPISTDTNITKHTYLSLARKIIVSQGIDTVANFGCFCASTELTLSKEFPDVQFHGIDRAPLIKNLNDEHFKTVNTTYFADDMLRWFEHASPVKKGMLVHMRTAVYCLPVFLEKLYRLARSKGYRHVLLLENVGFDRNTLTYPEFDTGFQSFMLRNWILVHDYPALLNRCGYEVGEQALVPLVNVRIRLLGAPNPDGSESLGLGGWILPDMHLLCLHATAD